MSHLAKIAARRIRVNILRTWFTPGSVVAAMIVALLWLHRLHLSIVAREGIQIVLVMITFAGLWILTQDRLSGG
jgi:hypothetical protein